MGQDGRCPGSLDTRTKATGGNGVNARSGLADATMRGKRGQFGASAARLLAALGCIIACNYGHNPIARTQESS